MKNYFLLLGVVCIALGSCSTGETPALSKMLGGSSQAIAFLNCKAVSENKIEFEFSKAVTVKNVSFDKELTVASIENGSTVGITLMEQKLPPGTPITADIVAVDEKKNSINVIVSFRTRNNHMPKLVINEFRTEYSNPRVEFIELKINTQGNLGAMRVFMAGSSQKPTVYDFSPVEVGKGEYVVLHLRKKEDECVDEYGSNLSESGGTDSSSNGRDIWFQGTDKLINKNGYVYVLDQDDNVLDAVMFSDKPDSWWTKDYLAKTAEFLYNSGAWKSADGQICSPADAVNSSDTTATRTICRDETVQDTNTAADWYIVYTSSATPGSRNNSRRWN